MAAAGLIVAFAAAIWISFGSPGWAIFGIVALVVALNRFFFPSRFKLDTEGITARFPLRTQRLGWADVRRFVVDEHGAYLSTRQARSRLDGYRGLHLLLGRNRSNVLDHIRAHLSEGARA